MASDVLTIPKNDLGNYLPGLDLNKVTSTLEYKYTSAEISDILGALETRLVAEINMVKADYPMHIAMILKRAFEVTTSPKARYNGEIEYEAGTGGSKTKYVLKDSFVFPAIDEICKKYKKSNSIRAFCTTLQDCFLAMARNNAPHFDNKRATRVGAPNGYGYITADFLTGDTDLLTNQEKAMMNSAARFALEKPSGGTTNSDIVSLYDYGRF